MPVFLNEHERERLKQIIRLTKDAAQLRRAQALTWFDEGRPVHEIASLLQVNPTTIYRWFDLFQERKDWSIDERVSEKRGTRWKKTKVLQDTFQDLRREIFDCIMMAREGYWTVESLTRHIRERKGIEVAPEEVKQIAEEAMRGWELDRRKPFILEYSKKPPQDDRGE